MPYDYLYNLGNTEKQNKPFQSSNSIEYLENDCNMNTTS